MVTTRQKQGAGVAATALLLLGSVYAWQSANQHKTNELSDTFRDNDVTLVEDFVPITDWLQGQEVNKDISVKNNTTAATGNNAYVRIQLKEFLEFTDKTEQRSTVRYAVTTEGNFAKFDTEDEAKTYAAANNLTGNPVQIPTTAFEGANYWFIPTNAPVSVSRDSLITKPSDPTKTDYKFAGWYAKSDLSGSAWDFATDKMPAANLTLYAKWEESTPTLTVPNTDPGSEFDFANAKWRILKTDMDDDATNGNQALVIRVNTLTNAEAGQGGTDTDEARADFRDGSVYFSADGSNGYEAGAGNTAYLKGAIDHYYDSYIGNNPDYVKYVQAVDLNNPSFAAFKDGISFYSGSDYSDWQWSDWNKDSRFKTTLGGAKQAFALSYGDIHTIAGVATTATLTAMLDFTSVSGSTNNFGLRSAGHRYDCAGMVSSGYFRNSNYMNSTLPVRPALSIQIQ